MGGAEPIHLFELIHLILLLYPMEELIKTFHIEYKMLIAQMLNFAIVFAVLWYFALKPLMKIMQDRSKTIEKSIHDAKKVEEKLTLAEQDYEKKLQRAKAEANKILTEAQKDAGIHREEMTDRAKTEIEKLVRDAKSQINDEKEAMIVEAQERVAEVLILSLEKVLGTSISQDIDQKIIVNALEDIKNK